MWYSQLSLFSVCLFFTETVFMRQNIWLTNETEIFLLLAPSEPECKVDSDCPKLLSCSRNRCIDPCQGICGYNSECTVINHKPRCTCLPNCVGNPVRGCICQREKGMHEKLFQPSLLLLLLTHDSCQGLLMDLPTLAGVWSIQKPADLGWSMDSFRCSGT